ncbi:BMC domain-containing protein [Geosporobacter ferrireducens]|uniref:BMC domain-containing protein n=1 Tax=Geosporobacter ferrireducens TaxID=1424294 RepID=A0A1D8GK99_9FIRM|nr:BMC domain-containing protein [Geosporobacter ferrireducens]AOT71336.1 hypothetical protein Gferi_18315 [Geosporobacter ferrireducens]MTI57647.1 BMC domain-containing protein [Geosporobacter ferrireducens]
MSRLALGLIETVGLAAAVEAADTAVKSANVVLLGYELTKGDGMVTIKLAGDVGAVKAAVEAGVAAASKVSTVYSKQIIPRPHEELEKLIYSSETVGMEKEESTVETAANEETADETEKKKLSEAVDVVEEESIATNEPVQEIVEEAPIIEEENEVGDEEEKKKEQLNSAPEKPSRKATCNLCHDPECIRRKGDIRSICLHYSSTKK